MGLMLDSTVRIAAERRGESPYEVVSRVVDRWADINLCISVVTASELIHGIWRAKDEARRTRREQFVEGILSKVPTVSVNLAIARVVARVGAMLADRGTTLPPNDLLIGCSALQRGDEILTQNVRHFAVIPGLVIRNWE